MKPLSFFNYMEYVYAVYQEGSFTRAAEKLFISQPALSLTIKKVENEIGHPIFERMGKNIKLTAIGEKYIRAIENTMRIQSKLTTEIDDILKLKNGIITVGAPPFVAENILPPVLYAYKSKYPDIEIRVIAEGSSTLEARIDNDETDVVIDNVAVFIDNYRYSPLMSERVFLAVGEKQIEEHGLSDAVIKPEDILSDTLSTDSVKKVPITTFQSECFILQNKGSKIRQIAKQIFEESKIIPNVSMEFEREETAIKYAEAGFGICFVSEKQLKYGNFGKTLHLLLPDTDYTDFDLYAVFKKSRYVSDTVREFIELLGSYLKT